MSYPVIFTTPGLRALAEEVDAERQRQLAKWGEQRHPVIETRDIPAVTHHYYASRADIWRQVNQERETPSRGGRCATCPAEDGVPHTHTAWDGVLLEEVYEALAEADPVKRRVELVQVMAVCAAMIAADEAAARRDATATTPVEGDRSAYGRGAWETYSRDAGCACTSPDPSTCAVSHRSGPWLCVCHRLSAELTEEERATLFPKEQHDTSTSADLERARRIAVALEQENAHLTAELAEEKASRNPRLRCLLVKAAPDRDMYVGWSDSCEMPSGVWSRETALEYGFPPSRLDRADENGSSDMSCGDGHWDDKGFIAEQRGWLRRDRLGDYAVEYLTGDRQAAYALLEPFEDEAIEPVAQLAGTQPCGHDDYHDGHEWADRPGVWCPGIGYDNEGAEPTKEA